MERGVAARELKEERDVIQGYGVGCGGAACRDVEKYHRARFEEMRGEDATVGSCENGEVLLEDVGEECDAPDDPERNAGAGVPGVSAATEGDDDHEEDEDGTVEDRAHPIDFAELLEVGDIGPWIARGEDEEVDGGEEGGEGEVDVEGLRLRVSVGYVDEAFKTYPAPGSTAHREGTTDDRAEDCANAPT